ncbi:MAG: LytTR family DNA-binding domain-containing protein [Bacteroidetes bacterium]|nr:LytTR family DNA-binding domain-containing protein [Bacteroidota bacterium]
MNKNITAVLIDDEFSALEILKIKLGKNFPEIEIAAEFQNPEDALEQLPNISPDLLFIDITMPQLSGFDLLSGLNLPNAEIIFVTAHNDFALEAIRHCAIGYVLKPIEDKMLKEAVQNALANLQKRSAAEKTLQLFQHLQGRSKERLVVPTQKGVSILKTEEIVRLEGMDGYTKICLPDKNCIVSSYNIGKFKDLLPEQSFIQLHKSHIVNVEFLKAIQNDGYAELKTGDFVPYSKSKKQEILNRL